MRFFLDYILPLVVLVTLVGLAAFILVRFRQGADIGAQLQPLTADDRLRLSLAITALEQAERELAKAAWVSTEMGGHPGHPRVGQLKLELESLRWRAQLLFRES